MVEKDIVTLLNEMLHKKDVEEIVRYFAFEFWDDCPDADETVLDYLNDRFYDIDMMRVDGKDVTETVYETLRTAIKMLDGTA